MAKKQETISEVAIIGEGTLRNKIYTIRGQKVMLDADLAEIYGYETKMFNRQVRNNIKKFDEDFMFRLTSEEVDVFLRCKKCTSKMCDYKTESLAEKNLASKNGGRGGNRYLPYAFTEQGIYMLMTVLRGELAMEQSKALIRMFRRMKDYVLENQELLGQREQLKMMMIVTENTKKVAGIEKEMAVVDERLAKMEKKVGDVVMRSEISPIILDFNKAVEQKEYVFLNGEPMRVSELYMDIYSSAKKSIYIIDDYVSIKTLRHLKGIKPDITVIIFSDNKRQYLSKSDYLDFIRECPEIKVEFIKTEGLIHDRFIIIDYGTKTETIYHCGASEKDAGGKIMAIAKFEDELVKMAMREVVERLRGNKELILE